MIAFAYPGAILNDRNFEFPDGETGNKLFIILTDGSRGYYVVARTTTNDNDRSKIKGCNLDDRRPGYFIPQNESIFDDDTWICLNYLTDFNKAELDRHLTKKEIKQVSRVTGDLFADIIHCAAIADDTTKEQEEYLFSMLENIRK